MEATMINFDVRQCHKWAQLLCERKTKLDQAISAVEKQDFDLAKKLVGQIFNGVMGGKQADPGMAGSLLYHMASTCSFGSSFLSISERNIKSSLVS
jgi:hypothetical protein